MEYNLKKIKIVGSIFLTLVLCLTQIINPLVAKAGEDVFEIAGARMDIFGGNVVPGFINSTNESFTIEFQANLVGDPESIELLVDGLPCQTPIFATSLSGGQFVFASSTISNPDLQLILPQNSLLNLAHSFQAEAKFDSGDIVEVELPLASVVADYLPAVADVSYETVENQPVGDGWLKIDDEIIFRVDATDGLTQDGDLTIGANFLGEPLDFIYSDTLNVYVATYKVKQGSGINAEPLTFSGLEVADVAGNETQINDIALTGLSIDGSLPAFVVSSPKDKVSYRNDVIAVDYQVENGTSVTAIELIDQDQKRSNLDISTVALEGLADGNYSLEITFSSVGGNIKKEIINFTVDRTVPFIALQTNVDGRELSSDELFNISGSSEPFSQVGLSFSPDGELFGRVFANANGEWETTLDTSKVAQGEHGLWIIAIDGAGNRASFYAGKIKINSPVVAVAKPIEFALSVNKSVASSNSVADVSPAIVVTTENKIDDSDVARSGAIVSSNDERTGLINWSVWLLTLAMIVLISAFLTAGYYGYGIISSRSSSSSATIRVAKPVAKEPMVPPKKIDNSDDDPEDKPFARW
jgi:hypothetical protein